MLNQNILTLAWRYYKIYGAKFFFIRLWNTFSDGAFARLSPWLGLGQKVPSPGDNATLNIFYLSGNEWELRTQRPQQLAKALARQGCSVHYCAPSSSASNATGWRISRKDERLWHVRFFSKKLYRLKDIYPSENYAGFTDSFEAYVRAVSKDKKAIILVQQPVWQLHLRNLEGIPIFYDCIDDHADFPNAPALTAEYEKALIQNSAGLVYTSDVLAKRLTPKGKTAVVIRNACEYEPFARPFTAVASSNKHKKVIGYHGALGGWFDSELVASVAETFPQHTVRLIGGYIPEVYNRLSKIPNIEMTGEVAYKYLPRYVHTFDVGLLPFRIQPLTMGTNPLKLYEYLAAGLPVVSVPLPETAQFGGLVLTGEGKDFIQAVNDALSSPANEKDFIARQTFAKKETWNNRAAEMIDFLHSITFEKASG